MEVVQSKVKSCWRPEDGNENPGFELAGVPPNKEAPVEAEDWPKPPNPALELPAEQSATAEHGMIG